VMPRDQQACLEAGMDEILTKPVNLDALAVTVKKAAARIVAPI